MASGARGTAEQLPLDRRAAREQPLAPSDVIASVNPSIGIRDVQDFPGRARVVGGGAMPHSGPEQHRRARRNADADDVLLAYGQPGIRQEAIVDPMAPGNQGERAGPASISGTIPLTLG
jgi:hypothetical protein